MEMLNNIVGQVNGIVWGVPMLIAILGTGAYLMIRLGFMPLRKVRLASSLLLEGRKPDADADGDISPFAALMTSLAATVGTGNIAGVATAITLGGPGALFWMWCTALVGMATKYAETVLAVHFRETDERGRQTGGPMYVIKNGLGSRWAWLGAAFALFGGLAAFGIGNMVQAHEVANAMQGTFAIPTWASAAVMVALTGFVVLGGISRIGQVAQGLVPIMCLAYVLIALVVVGLNIDQVPAAFTTIFKAAFTGQAATGGFAGAAVWAAVRFGVARGVFSNEAGLGTAGIAQAAGMSNSPVKSGLIGMMGTFIDTLIVCTLTGLAIICTGAWTGDAQGAALTAAAFETSLPGAGAILVSVSLAVFAFTTILGWAYYAERCWEFLLGTWAILPFRVLWIVAIPAGALAELNFVWLLADTLNAFMALPNLVSLLLLSGTVAALTKAYFSAQN